MLSSLLPYVELMRLHKPVGILNIFFPYLYGFLYAALTTNPIQSQDDTLPRLPLLFFSAFLLRSLGCSWNDIADRHLDRFVARTRSRPIARGAISVPAACVFTLAQLFVWLSVLAQQVPPRRLVWYVVPLVLMVAAYPYAKRVTDFAQVILGVTLGWGLLVGAAVAGMDVLAIIANARTDTPLWFVGHNHRAGAMSGAEPSWPGAEGNEQRGLMHQPQLQGLAALYAAYIVWAVIHDTIYAYQDVRDDTKMGIKSMAVLTMGWTKPLLFILSGVQVALLAGAGMAMNNAQLPTGKNVGEMELDSRVGVFRAGLAYSLIAVWGNALVLAVMVTKVDLSDPHNCAWWFQAGSVLVGASLGIGLGAEYLLTSMAL